MFAAGSGDGLIIYEVSLALARMAVAGNSKNVIDLNNGNNDDGGGKATRPALGLKTCPGNTGGTFKTPWWF